MVFHVQKILFWGILCGLLALALIILMIHMSELIFGSSESANRAITYLVKGQSVSMVLLALVTVSMNADQLRKLF